MKVRQLPVNQGDYSRWSSAVAVAQDVNRTADNITSRFPANEQGLIEHHSVSDGVGPSIYGLRKETDFKLQVDSHKQATGMGYSYQQTDHGYLSERLRLGAEGANQVYERSLYSDYGGQIFSKTERVKVAPDGKFEYELVANPKVDRTNWLRRNRSVEMLGHLGLGAAVGGGLGYALAGGAGAAVGGFLCSALAGSVAHEDAMMNDKSVPDTREYKLFRPVARLRTAVNVGAALAGVGAVALLLGAF